MLSKHKSRATDIWLVVSVPVLSEQMTVVQPSVSTLGSVRTIAFCFAIFLLLHSRKRCQMPGIAKSFRCPISCSLAMSAKQLVTCLVPSARQVVTTAGRPSGMAATARATAILK